MVVVWSAAAVLLFAMHSSSVGAIATVCTLTDHSSPGTTAAAAACYCQNQ